MAATTEATGIRVQGPPASWDLSACTAPFESAVTLPAACYTDPAFFAAEVETIFRGDWVCIGRADEVPNPGDYACAEMVGEPLVMVRGEDRALRVFSSVCRHRSMPVASGAGNARSLVCPYHAWTYDLTGRLVGAPEMGKTPDFDAKSVCLPEIRHTVWLGFVMVNLDGRAEPFAPPLAPLEARIANWRLDEMRSVAHYAFDYPWNWKVMIDNYIECYHHPTIHGKSLEPSMPGRASYFEPEEGPFSIMQMPYRKGHRPTDPRRPGDDAPRLPLIETLDEAELSRGATLQILPTLLVSLYPTHMDYYCMFPEGPSRLRLRKSFCVLPEQMARPDYEAGIAATTANYLKYAPEDLGVCRGLQSGLSAGLSQPSRYCHMEVGDWRFAKYVAERVTGA